MGSDDTENPASASADQDAGGAKVSPRGSSSDTSPGSGVPAGTTPARGGRGWSPTRTLTRPLTEMGSRPHGRPTRNTIMTDDRQTLRGTDTNSLLRLYDRAVRMSSASPLQLDRQRAVKAVQRLGDELRRRGSPP